jgi:serine/threonine-protein kinase
VAESNLGPYMLLKRLGRGAQGDVWKAMRLEPPRGLFALKILNPGLKNNPARMAQFRREAERGIRLSGRSLLTVFEMGEAEGYVFMVMPYVEGTPLREVIRGRRLHLHDDEPGVTHGFVTLNPEAYMCGMIRMLARVVTALARVHDRGIAHRDIKPANILLDNRNVGEAYLCDFGLGRDLQFATAEQMRDGAGTPMYMAPERLLRLTADEVKCDIYSMGVTLFEALTLKRPFVVPDHVSLAALVPLLASARPRLPTEICANFPTELEEIIMKAMASEPARRFDSARELARRLECFDLGCASRGDRAPLIAPDKSRLEPRDLAAPGVRGGTRLDDLASAYVQEPAAARSPLTIHRAARGVNGARAD